MREPHATLSPAAAPEPVRAWLERMRPIIDAALDRRLPSPEGFSPEDPARALAEGMRYAALGPGKRLRPAICLAACASTGGREEDALPAAAAVELVHSYTLVHDDLPAMDDDDLRRGRATVHRAFGEATAILVGDGLLTQAFAALADLEGGRAADALRVLASRAGSEELLAGQARDLAGASALEELESVHRDKTGALFSGAAELGAICAGAGAEERETLSRYGLRLGVAFQHADDRDDGEHAALRECARARVESLACEAEALARSLGEGAEPLSALAGWIRSQGATP